MKPQILLIGYGKFGHEHFEVLWKMHQENSIILAGVVTKNQKITNLPKNIPTYTKLNPSLLKSVDAVIIVTPITTHYKLTNKCLQYTNVFVEKPLAITTFEGNKLIEKAKHNKKILAVGHIFRFNHSTYKLKQLISLEKEPFYYIEGKFTGGVGEPAKDCGVVTSDMHLIDVLDYILDVTPSSVYCKGWTYIDGYQYEDQASIILNYPPNIHAYIKLGWVKTEKIRSLVFYFPKKEISADLLTQTIVVKEYNKAEETIFCFQKQPLRMELEEFVKKIKNGTGNYVTGEVANRIVGIIEMLRKSMKKNTAIYA